MAIRIPQTLTSIELFTGAGGLALGIAKAGFGHRLVVEYNRNACDSLRENERHFGGHALEVHEGDVRQVDFTRFQGELDLLAAGAPCQPFSIGGKHRAHSDERNLFPEVFRAQRECAPRVVLIENVKGLLRESLHEYVEYIHLRLARPEANLRDQDDPNAWRSHLPILRKQAKSDTSGIELAYSVSHALLQAADYGVPQRRERVFFVAVRSDLGTSWIRPQPTHSASALWYSQWGSGDYWKRHNVRAPRQPNQGHRFAGVGASLLELPWRTLRDAIGELPEPRPGKPHPDWLNHVGQPGAKSYPGHTGSPMDEPAKTLKAGVHGVPGGENMLRHLNGTVRYLTVREAARVQTFPDAYEVRGAWGEAMRQLGNAVPVDLAAAVAGSIGDVLRTAGSRAALKAAI